jgi:hypothetical protein
MLEYAQRERFALGLVLNLIWRSVYAVASMTLDEKVRYGMIALGGASVVLATLGVHISPLSVIGGMGTT